MWLKVSAQQILSSLLLPVDKVVEHVELVRQHCNAATLITDCGSTKRDIVRACTGKDTASICNLCRQPSLGRRRKIGTSGRPGRFVRWPQSRCHPRQGPNQRRSGSPGNCRILGCAWGNDLFYVGGRSRPRIGHDEPLAARGGGSPGQSDTGR